MVIDWADRLLAIGTITVPILIAMWNNRRKAKKEVEQLHQQNQNALEEIKTDMRYFTPHNHMERVGPLTAEGIRRRDEVR